MEPVPLGSYRGFKMELTFDSFQKEYQAVSYTHLDVYKRQELNYTKNGDYLIPDIQLSVQEQKPLGKYGRMRRAFLQENNTLLRCV